MASNYTQKYKLNQWAAEDRVLRADFNADNAKLEAALAALDSGKANTAELDGKADRTELNQVVQNLSSQGVELAARNCAIALTSYSGNGAQIASFRFSGKPWMVIFFENTHFATMGVRGMENSYVVGSDVAPRVKFTWSENSVSFMDEYGSTVNFTGRTYTLLAFLEP